MVCFIVFVQFWLCCLAFLLGVMLVHHFVLCCVAHMHMLQRTWVQTYCVLEFVLFCDDVGFVIVMMLMHREFECGN